MARPKKITSLLAKARRDERRLGAWMCAHVEELSEALGDGRINWRPMMVVIRDLGLVDEHGQPPSRDTTARTWARVRRTAEAQRQGRATKALPPLRPDEIAPGVRILARPPAGSFHGTLVSQPHLDLRPARPRAETAPAAPQLGAAAALSGTPLEDATEQIGRVLRELGARRVRIPGRSA